MAGESKDDITAWLERARAGDRDAAERIYPVVYAELRRLAGARRRAGGATPTLDTTALVHEAYLRLVGRDAPWESRGHFFGTAARAMRSILVDRARQRKAAKRGGDARRQPLDEALAWFEARSLDVVDLDEALEALGAVDPRKRGLVDLRFFVGLSTKDAAELLGISDATAERDWAFARAWLQARLQGTLPG